MMIDDRNASSESTSRLHAFDAFTFSGFSRSKTFRSNFGVSGRYPKHKGKKRGE